MAHLLYKWINDDVVLSKKISNFAKDFSNGYLFADLLRVYNQINDFELYVNKSASSAKITNFCRLEPVFRSLGIKFDSKIAFEIIKEYPRTALNLVSKLKNVLDKISSNAASVIGRPRQDGIRRLANMPLRLNRPRYDKAQHEMFEKSIRTYIRAQNEVDMAKHLKPFTDFQANLEQTAYEEGVAALKAFFAEKDMIRQQRRQNLQREHEFLHDWQEKGIEEWAYNQQIQKEREDHTRRMKRRAKNVKSAAEATARLKSNAEAVSGVEQFEQTLLYAEMMKAKTSVQADELTASMNKRAPKALGYDATSKMDMDEFFKTTKRQAGNPKQWKLEYKKSIGVVRETKERRKALREQRERRRRKFLADSQRSRAAQASDAEKAMMCKKLVGKPNVEKDLLDDLEKISFHTKIFRKNRDNRENSYRMRRELDEEESVLRDNQVFMLMRSSYEEEVAQQRERIAKYGTARTLAKKRATIKFCNQTVRRVVELALRMTERRGLREHAMEHGVKTELNSVFVLGDLAMDADGAVVGPISPDAGAQSKIAESEFINYLNGQSFWGEQSVNKVVGDAPTEEKDGGGDDVSAEPAAEEATDRTVMTGRCVQTLQDTVDGTIPAPDLDLPARMPITVCVVGKPFSGKSEQARRLSDKYNLAVIDVDTLVNEALQWAESKEAEVMSLEGTLQNVDDRAYHERISSIGSQIKPLLMAGTTLPDEYFIRLILSKIRLVVAQALTVSRVAIETEIDVNRDSFSNEDEYRVGVLRLVFDAWDADNSGSLDVAELVAAVRSFGEGLSQEQLKEEAMELVHQMDEDHDNSITFKECCDYFLNLFAAHPNEIFDATMTTILAATRQKPYRGWILDGFPTNANQARLLEKALTGYNDDGKKEDAEAFAQRFSLAIASQPDRPPVDPEALFGKSGIDIVLNINVPTNAVCRRALGRRNDPLDLESKYHVEFNPPNAENPIKMRLEDPTDMNKWRAMLAPTLSAYEDNFPEMDKWFKSFNSIYHIKPFLPQGGAALGDDALFDLVDGPLKQFKDAKQAREVKEKAELTFQLRKKTALRTFTALVAEHSAVSTEDLRNAFAALKSEFSQRYDNILVAQLKNDDDGVAAQFADYNDIPRLAPKTFGNLVTQLNKNLESSGLLEETGREIATEESFLGVIFKAAGKVGILASSFSHLLSSFQRKVTERLGSKEFKVETLYRQWCDGPVEMPHVTCSVDSIKLKQVLSSYNAKVREMQENPEDPPPEELAIVPNLFDLGDEEVPEEPAKGKKKGKTPEPSESADPVSGSVFVKTVMNLIYPPESEEEKPSEEMFGAILKVLGVCVSDRIAGAAEDAPPPPEQEAPPPPEFQPLGPVDFSASADVEGAKMVVESWNEIVKIYSCEMMVSFDFLSSQRSQILEYAVETREKFHAYLSRADGKNRLVLELQKQINSISDDIRFDDDVKAELHERVRSTMNAIQKMLEEKNEAAQTALDDVRTNQYLENNVTLLAKEISKMMQSEFERFYSTRRFLVDSACLKQGVVAPEYEAKNGEDDPAIMKAPPTVTDVYGGTPAAVDDEDAGGKGKKGKKGNPAEDEDEGQFDPYKALDHALSMASTYITELQECEVARRAKVKEASEATFADKLAAYDAENNIGGGKKGGGTPLPEFPEASGSDDLATALAYEEEMFVGRLNRLLNVARREGDAILSYGTLVYDKLDGMIKKRFDEEYSACYACETYARETIENETQFEYLVELGNTADSSVDRLVADEDRKKTHMPQENPIQMYGTGPAGFEFTVKRDSRFFPIPKAPPAPHVEAFFEDKFSVTQEALLSKQFAAVNEMVNGIVTKPIVVDLLKRLGACGNLPMKWNNMTVSQYNDLVKTCEDIDSKIIRLDELMESLLVR